MSAEPAGSEGSRAGAAPPERAPRALRMLAVAAVTVGLAALAAGTFVLSYSGIHALALHAGIAPRLARGYPLLIDAMLVIVLAAVLALRGADLPSKLLAWVTLLALLAAAAGADALHAVGRKLPRHVAAVTAAVLPWVLVFLAFALLLAMLRHVRLRRLAAANEQAAADSDALSWWQPGSQDPDLQPAPALLLAHEPDADPGGLSLEPELAVDAEPGPDDPSSDEAAAEPPAQIAETEGPGPIGQAEQTAEQGEQTEPAEDQGQPAEDQGQPAQEPGQRDDPDMPVFHRMWSSPTPPESPA